MALPRRFLPPLSALTAFEAAARHQGFTAAAKELNISQAAVSRRVQLLEEILGLTLFERIRKRVVLTPAGAAYARELQRSEEHTSELQSRENLVCRLLLEKKTIKTSTTTQHTP